MMESTESTDPIPGGKRMGETKGLEGYLSRIVPLTWEKVLLFFLVISGLISRLSALGMRVMSHDESLHVFYSWQLASGRGFTHDPMMHGPLLFEATAFVNLFLGANDFTSRLVPALLGVFIVVGIPQLLKPWLGRAGALVASVFLLISPFVLYFSRYLRHDILVIFWTLLAILAIFRYLADRKENNLVLLAVALALMLSTMEIAFIYLALLAGFLILSAFSKYRLSWKMLYSSAEYDLLVVLITLGAFFSSPISLLVLNPIWTRFTGAPFVDMAILNARGMTWAVGASGIRLWGLFAIFAIAAVIIGLRWNWRRWLKLVAVFGMITVFLFTTFFSNPAGLGTGFIGSLGYWLSQQGVARGSQPWYYYLFVFPIYEYLPLVGGLLAMVMYFVRRKKLSAFQNTFVAFLIWWAVGIFVALSMAGEKMPWLSTHIAIPFILLTAWWFGQLIEKEILTGKRFRIQISGMSKWFGLGLISLLAILTARTSFTVNYVNYDYSTEWIDYAHGAPGVKWVLNDIAAIANHTGAGPGLKIAFDDEVSWPMSWYLRGYSNQVFYGDQPNRQGLDAAVVIAGPKHWSAVESILGNRYHRFEVIRLWWPLEDYRNLTWERIRNAISDPSMRSALWDIFWNRDFQKYAANTSQDLNPPANWPLADRMRVYVRKDIASQMLSLSLGPNMLEDLPAPSDAYLTVQRSVAATSLIENKGFNAPRAVAIGQDGSIYIADTGNSRIIHLDAKGNILTTWGSRTSDGQVPPTPGTFIEPWGIALDSKGNVYVTDTWNHRVQKFDAQGNFLLEWGIAGQPGSGPYGFWGPRGIAVGSDDRVYVTDTGNKRVVLFDENGIFLLEFGTSGEGQLDEPVGIALGPDGQVYVADTWNTRVVVFSSDGEYRTSWPVQAWTGNSLDEKPYIAVDKQGRVYITDPEGYRVIVFSASGEALAVFGQYGPETDSFGMPTGLAVDLNGALWVVDAGNNRLAKFDVWK
jgi:uncharacterized protein (TIGR03663 family)